MHGFSHATADGLCVKRFDLNGYVADTDYSLGRNTGNTYGRGTGTVGPGALHLQPH